jgi:TetR/AcrR family transcriptional regulator, transcriptional repressor for nem operon
MSRTTQNTILEKAERMFHLRGYEGTSLNDLVEKAGVSKGAFFHYYPNKQAISKTVIDKYAREILLGLAEKNLSGTADVKQGLLNWVQEIFTTYKQWDFKGGCLMGNLALELSDQNDAAREDIKGHFLSLENLLTSYLKKLADEDRLSMEPRQFARLLIASIQGVTMMTKAHKDQNRAGREFLAVGQLIELAIKS